MEKYILFFIIANHALLGRAGKIENCYTTEIDPERNKLLCFGNKENLVYNSTSTNITEVILVNSKMTTMNASFFETIQHSVQTLSMSHGNLPSVDEDIFKNLIELKRLNLSFNKIVNVSEKAFVNNHKLTHISFMANEIRELKKSTFSTLLDLESIDLTRNRLNNLDKHLFEDNANLATISMKFNNLTEISSVMFHALPKLKDLDLSFNKLTAIPAHIFKYNYALKRLNLQENKIKNLDLSLSHLGLEELNLLGNPIDMNDRKNRHVLKELLLAKVKLTVNYHHHMGNKTSHLKEKDDGQGTFKLSPGVQGVILTLLIAIFTVLSLLLYLVYVRKYRHIYKRHYPKWFRSKERLEEDEESNLQMNVSDRSVAFHKDEDEDSAEDHEESCSCSKCFKRVTHVNVT